MDEKQHRTVQKYRKQLESINGQVNGAVPPNPSDTRAVKTYQRLQSKQAEYAKYRLQEGLGPDPMQIEDPVLEKTLNELIDKSKLSRLADMMAPTRIDKASRYEMLLSNFSLADALGASGSDSMAHLSEKSPVKKALRRWACQINDAFVHETVDQLRRLSENFENSIGLFHRRLDRVRSHYEADHHADQLFMVKEDGIHQLRASSNWGNIEAHSPEEVREVYGIFRSAEQQLKEIDEIKELLNGEIRKFMSALVPLYLAYVQQQCREVQRAVLGKVKLNHKLAERLLSEATQADYLLPGSGLTVAHPKIPQEFALFRKLKSYQNFKRSTGIEQLQNQATVEFPTNR
ncbi:MAG: hypothetical protein O3B01_12530 [Planctomycetota bacterium]|nr:hypothetical protein [Planctomycetota bacterium]MDA1139403.1 hypothetical protein [Planctomycetota bacterium]